MNYTVRVDELLEAISFTKISRYRYSFHLGPVVYNSLINPSELPVISLYDSCNGLKRT